MLHVLVRSTRTPPPPIDTVRYSTVIAGDAITALTHEGELLRKKKRSDNVT